MSMATANAAKHRPMTAEERKVIIASSAGTVFEWYDFYLAGSLAANIAAAFVPGTNETARFIFVLFGFAAGFAVRPFGALFFGRLGDLIGRKYTFLVTMTLMGIATFVVGLLPTYEQIGYLAPVGFIVCRLAQGLALGGEYGGAATYVAEHSPPGRRGFYTSWIQTTATVGLFLSLLVILTLRLNMDPATFNAPWGGWRIPFLVSIILLAVSIWIRLQLAESPAFQKMKAEGTGSKAPLTEAFGRWENIKIGLVALFGGTAGQAVVWYTGQFYALFFLTQTLKVDGTTANLLIAFSLLLGTPFFIFFGWLSDKIGRKPILLAGCLIAAASYMTLFKELANTVNPALYNATQTVKVQLTTDTANCSNLFDPVGVRSFSLPCDVVRRTLATNSIHYTLVEGPAGSELKATVNGTEAAVTDKTGAALVAAAQAAGYPKPGDATILKQPTVGGVLSDPRAIRTMGILFILVIFVTMVYGPIAALLVELFPTRIRYTGMSLPYHLGNGWFGGFLPPTAFAIVASTGDIFAGLWYPIVIALITFVIGLLFLPETKDRDIYAND